MSIERPDGPECGDAGMRLECGDEAMDSEYPPPPPVMLSGDGKMGRWSRTMPDAPGGALRMEREVNDMEARRLVLSRIAREVALVPRSELTLECKSSTRRRDETG